jgi:hypothetical protein
LVFLGYDYRLAGQEAQFGIEARPDPGEDFEQKIFDMVASAGAKALSLDAVRQKYGVRPNDGLGAGAVANALFALKNSGWRPNPMQDGFYSMRTGAAGTARGRSNPMGNR